MQIIRGSVFAIAACFSASASASDYARLQTGELKGKVIVQWLEPDVFLFTPDPVKPLQFKRRNGTVIIPGKMLTDGGSIPRPMWAFRSYSPWGYAPAFIVHDWLFHIRRCKIDPYAGFTLNTAADVMGEVIKTMMESGKVEKDASTVNLMMTAVKSRFAKNSWNSELCIPVPPTFDRTPILEYTIEF